MVYDGITFTQENYKHLCQLTFEISLHMEKQDKISYHKLHHTM